MKKTIVILLLFVSFSVVAQKTEEELRAAKIANRAVEKSANNDYEGALTLLNKAVSFDPNNAEIEFDLGCVDLKLAESVKGKIIDGFVKNIGSEHSYYDDAAEAFKKAISISPKSAYYYNLGIVYYNQAIDYNERMSEIKGSSADDFKEYSTLKQKRNEYFVKSQPYFEKAVELLSPNEIVLTGEDMKTYKSTIIALREVYQSEKNTEKVNEMKNKIASLK